MQSNSTAVQSIGIDVSKLKLDIAIKYNQSYKLLSVFNNVEGISNLSLTLREVSAANCPIVVEATGDYQNLLTDTLYKEGFNIKLINPLITKSYQKSSIRKTKTDKEDSKLLAEIGLKEEDLKSYIPSNTRPLRPVVRYYHRLIKQRQQIKTRLTTLKDVGLEQEFLKNLLAQQLELIKKQLKDIEKEILKDTYIKETLNQLGKVKGVSMFKKACLIVELGDITRFNNKKSIVGFSGLDPSICSSGSSVHGKSRLSKRGSSIIRTVIFQIGWGLATHNKRFQELYKKYRLEGKHYYTVLIILGRKFLRMFYHCIKYNVQFNSDMA